MKSKKKNPTEQNIKNALKNDIIDRNADLLHFLRMLDGIEGNYSVALNAKWGEGKTFFIKEAKYIIDSLTNDESIIMKDDNQRFLSDLEQLKSCMTVYFDAWKYDNDDDPVLSLIWTILEENEDVVEPNIFELTAIIKSIADAVSGRSVSKIADALGGKSLLQELKKTRRVEEEINRFFSLLNVEKANKLIIFIDELDRCKPDYAVKLLERMKHYLCHDDIIIVYSLNIEQLQHAVRKVYGYGYDALLYLDRFFDIRVPLPKADRTVFISNNQSMKVFDIGIVCTYVIKYYQLSLREIENYISQTEVVINKYLKDDDIYDSTEYVIASLLLPPLIGAYLFNYQSYLDFMNGQSCEEVVKILDHEDVVEEIGHWLYSDDETYEEEYANPEIELIRFSEKLKILWNNIIGYSNIKDGATTLGSILITDRTKYQVECMLAGLSDCAEYSYNRYANDYDKNKN